MNRVRLLGILLACSSAIGLSYALHLYAQRDAYQIVWERYLEIGVDRAIVRSQSGGYAFLAQGELVRIGEDGSEHWRQPAVGWALFETRDGGFIVAGEADSEASGAPAEGTRESRPGTRAISKYSSDGRLLWGKSVANVRKNETALFYRGSSIEDGFALVGYRAIVAETDRRGFVERQHPAGLWLAVFSDAGEFRWEAVLTLESGYKGPTLEAPPTRPIQATDGSIFLALASPDLAGPERSTKAVHVFKISGEGREVVQRRIDRCVRPSMMSAGAGLMLVCQELTKTGSWAPSVRAVYFDRSLQISSMRVTSFDGALHRALHSENSLYLVGTSFGRSNGQTRPVIANLDGTLTPVARFELPFSGRASHVIDASTGRDRELVLLWRGARLTEKTVGAAQIPVWLDGIVKIRVK